MFSQVNGRFGSTWLICQAVGEWPLIAPCGYPRGISSGRNFRGATMGAFETFAGGPPMADEGRERNGGFRAI